MAKNPSLYAVDHAAMEKVKFLGRPPSAKGRKNVNGGICNNCGGNRIV